MYLQQCNPDTSCQRNDIVYWNLGEVLACVAGPHQSAPFLSDNQWSRKVTERKKYRIVITFGYDVMMIWKYLLKNLLCHRHEFDLWYDVMRIIINKKRTEPQIRIRRQGRASAWSGTSDRTWFRQHQARYRASRPWPWRRWRMRTASRARLAALPPPAHWWRISSHFCKLIWH